MTLQVDANLGAAIAELDSGEARAELVAAQARISGVVLSGKTGTAQSGRKVNGVELNHAWFAGYAPADQPKIVVAVMLEYGGHGTRAAQIASRVIEHYLKVSTVQFIKTEGE